MKRICFVVATPMTARSFLRDHFNALAAHYQITLMANFEDASGLHSDFPGVETIHVPIARKIRPWADLTALLALYRLFRNGHYSSVHSVTPKAGLLSMLAGWAARVPSRYHTFTGQVWATQHGFYQQLLKALDRIIFQAATEVLVDSRSQRDFLIEQGVINATRATVLADGSISGVNIQRFVPSACAKSEVRAELGLPPDAFLFLFLGRLNAEKGIAELVRGFRKSGCVEQGAVLMLIGPEEEDVLAGLSAEAEALTASLVRIGFTDQAQRYMAAADVFCLPSHREGFGSVIIEAAACGVPALASNIYGINDAVVDGVTGMLHPAKDEQAIAAGMKLLMVDRNRLEKMGANARERALASFSSERVTDALVGFYKSRLVTDA
jgi:glycosyltransferase involved in cell wall biosynthesis